MFEWFYLYRQWLVRELQVRFRSSAVGAGWLVLQPLVHILLFTLVFYKFFQIRWPGGGGSASEYGLQVFIGLSLFGFLAEVINRGPVGVLSYPYLITKVRFPLQLLPGVLVGAAGAQLLLSLTLASLLALFYHPSWAALLVPLCILPFVLYAWAVATLLGCLGIYIRDLAHLAPSVSSLLMFLSPVFYPATMIPADLQWLVSLNPLAWTAESVRAMLLHGVMPVWQTWGAHLAVAVACVLLSRWVFKRIEPGFADVL